MSGTLYPFDAYPIQYRMIPCPDCLSMPGIDCGSLRQPEPCPTCAGEASILHPDEVEALRRLRDSAKFRLADLKPQPRYAEGFGRFES